MNIQIKTDPKLFHHYIIAVGVHPMTARKLAGQMFLKYRPIHFTNEDVKSMEHAYMLTKDKLFKTSNSEAFQAVGCEELSSSISGVKLAAHANHCTLHHFSSEHEMDEDDFVNIVKAANTSDYFKEKLLDSIIRG